RRLVRAHAPPDDVLRPRGREPFALRPAPGLRAQRGQLMPLRGKQIVLGVCGSIACYKAADLTSKLVQAGAVVDVVLTDSAQKFVTPFTFHSLTGRSVYTDMWEPATGAGEEHVALARRADLIIVAPATAT